MCFNLQLQKLVFVIVSLKQLSIFYKYWYFLTIWNSKEVFVPIILDNCSVIHFAISGAEGDAGGSRWLLKERTNLGVVRSEEAGKMSWEELMEWQAGLDKSLRWVVSNKQLMWLKSKVTKENWGTKVTVVTQVWCRLRLSETCLNIPM